MVSLAVQITKSGLSASSGGRGGSTALLPDAIREREYRALSGHAIRRARDAVRPGVLRNR